MTKRKKRRPNLPQETLARARAELYGEDEAAKMAAEEAEAEAASPAKAKPETKTRKSYKGGRVKEVLPAATSIEELRDEYVYVLADLRSMGILAGVLFVGLVAASLILV
jgi:hypothetical protein